MEGEGRHSGGGLDEEGLSSKGDLGEEDGSRPNPLTSSTYIFAVGNQFAPLDSSKSNGFFMEPSD